jgi:glycine cleavage system H lipoate-binding protein
LKKYNKIIIQSVNGVNMAENEELVEVGEGYAEIKMGAGWFLTITLASSEKYENQYIEIAKERAGQKKGRFNLNPKYARTLGEALIKFADANEL